MNFATIDIFFVVIILGFAIAAYIKGFIDELFTKLAFLLGLIGAVLLYDRTAPFIYSYVPNVFAAQILGFLAVFIVVYLVVRIVQKFIGVFFQNDILAGLNKALGFFLGIAEGIFIVAACLILMNMQPWVSVDGILQDSFFVRILAPLLADPKQYMDIVINSVALQ